VVNYLKKREKSRIGRLNKTCRLIDLGGLKTLRCLLRGNKGKGEQPEHRTTVKKVS